jgi:hypothetical protein
MGSFWPALVLIMFSGHTFMYGGQQMPDNIVDTTLTWINQARAQERLEILAIDPRLNEVADKYSGQMIEHNMLSVSNPDSGSPFERIRSSGLTDINNQVIVAMAKTLDILREQLESPENLSKLLSSEMTHAGIGIKQDSAGNLWLTVHMVERSIHFARFTLSQSNTTPVSRSITINGNTTYKKVRIILVPPEDSNPDLAVDRIIVPDSNDDFEITLTFGTATGTFDFEFYVQKDGAYKLINLFTMDI